MLQGGSAQLSQVLLRVGISSVEVMSEPAKQDIGGFSANETLCKVKRK